MVSHRLIVCLTLVWLILAGTGCMTHNKPVYLGQAHEKHDVLLDVATEIDFPDAKALTTGDARDTPPPIEYGAQPEFWDMSLEEAVQLTLANSPVLRDMGGMVLEAPVTTSTIYDAAIQETDPRFGVDAALSEFDASFAATTFFEKNDRPLNNALSEGIRLFRQDIGLYNFELSKPTAVGTDLFIRKVIDYDDNNSPFTFVPNAPWTDKVEIGFRQRLLQGAGVNFNRIAGLNGSPGFYNGVLIARVNTDITLAEFEASVRDLISSVENAYWELYFAYRDLDAKVQARKRSLETWKVIHALYEKGQEGAEADKEWLAREQYFRLDAEVKEAVMGRMVEKTRTIVFRGYGGVHASERRLRFAMGLPAADGRLIRPATEPSMAKVTFDWPEIVEETLTRRVELRKQNWKIKRREMELLAARNFMLPRLDAVALYRFRGIGSDLISTNRHGKDRFNNAAMDLTSGDFQEWQLGLDFMVPFGNRQARAAVRNAELQIARERAILAEQEIEAVNGLSAAVAETQRSYLLAKANYDRRQAAYEQLKALEAVFADPLESDMKEFLRLLDLLLNAQRRLADADSNFQRSMAEYAVAIKNVHFSKGSLLDHNQIYLSEGPWPRKAYADARLRARSRRPRPLVNEHIKSSPPIVSAGPYPQDIESPIPSVEELPRSPADPPSPETKNSGDESIRPLPIPHDATGA